MLIHIVSVSVIRSNFETIYKQRNKKYASNYTSMQKSSEAIQKYDRVLISFW